MKDKAMEKDMEIVFPGGQKVDVLYKGFTIETDQSKGSGGTGLAPAPFDLFLSSFGACAGIYVLRFCHKRNIPAGKIKLFLRTEKNKETHMVAKIKIEIKLPPEFPMKYKEAVVKAAELCTVTRHLYDPPVISVGAGIQEEH